MVVRYFHSSEYNFNEILDCHKWKSRSKFAQGKNGASFDMHDRLIIPLMHFCFVVSVVFHGEIVGEWRNKEIDTFPSNHLGRAKTR